MDTFYGILEEFLPLAGRYISETLSSPTKNAIQVASKVLRSLLHMHGPNNNLEVKMSCPRKISCEYKPFTCPKEKK